MFKTRNFSKEVRLTGSVRFGTRRRAKRPSSPLHKCFQSLWFKTNHHFNCWPGSTKTRKKRRKKCRLSSLLLESSLISAYQPNTPTPTQYGVLLNHSISFPIKAHHSSHLSLRANQSCHRSQMVKITSSSSHLKVPKANHSCTLFQSLTSDFWHWQLKEQDEVRYIKLASTSSPKIWIRFVTKLTTKDSSCPSSTPC